MQCTSLCLITHERYPTDVRARRMAEALVGAGYAVDLLCLSGTGQPVEETLGGVHVLRLPVTRHQGAGLGIYLWEYASFFLLAALRLYRLHRQRHYALVQVHSPPEALVFCTLPLKLAGVPLVLDLSELTPELFMSRFGVGRGRPLTGTLRQAQGRLFGALVRLLTALEHWACAYASAVLVLHEPHRQIVIGRSAPAAKLTQVMNCPDERLFAPIDPPHTPPVVEGTGGEFVVIYHGGIFERYGIDLLVKAVARVRAQIPGIRLELYGDGDFRPQVEALVAGLPKIPDRGEMSEIVRIHGRQPIDQMRQAIAAADVGVVPMRQDVYTDCVLPTKLLEYVTMGVPAIAARTATAAAYFDDSMVQFFAPEDVDGLADRLVALYRNPAARRAQAERARSFTAAHNWQGEKAAYLKLVERLTQTHRVFGDPAALEPGRGEKA
jgi:glycosyltransferase involved in cell wall biosynthesis